MKSSLKITENIGFYIHIITLLIARKKMINITVAIVAVDGRFVFMHN